MLQDFPVPIESWHVLPIGVRFAVVEQFVSVNPFTNAKTPVDPAGLECTIIDGRKRVLTIAGGGVPHATPSIGRHSFGVYPTCSGAWHVIIESDDFRKHYTFTVNVDPSYTES